jgi:predicted HTH domain antitoxin
MSAPLTIELPEDLLVLTHQSREEFVQEAKFLLAAKLFELGRISSGRAAGLCDRSRVDFLLALGRIGISAIQTTPEELREELRQWDADRG